MFAERVAKKRARPTIFSWTVPSVRRLLETDLSTSPQAHPDFEQRGILTGQ
jgi:hypothetical protein